MKNSVWDNRLWQIKMQELPLEGDGDAAWNKMQGLLDEVMPVTYTAPGVAKKLFRAPKSWIITIVYTGIIVAILLLAAHFLLKQHPHKTVKPQKEHIKNIKTTVVQPENSPSATPDKNSPVNNNPPSASQSKGDSSSNAVSSAKANSSNVADNNHSDKKKAGSTVGGNTAKQQNTSAKSQGLAGNILAANPQTGGKGKPNHAVKNISGNSGTVVPLGNGYIASHNTGHYLSGRRNKSTHSTGQHPQTSGSAAAGNKNQSASQTTSMLADNNSSKTNSLLPTNKTNPNTIQGITKPVNNPVAVPSKNTDTTKLASNKANTTSKLATGNTAVNKPAKPITNPTVKNNKTESYSKFQVGMEAGINTGKNSTTPYAGLSGSYAVNSRFSIGIGANVFSSRTITGKYNIGKYNYTTQDDSGRITSYTAKNLLVSTSQKISTVEIPLIATYKINKWLSVKGGPVISIPIKTGLIQNTLAPVGSPLDTARALKTLSSGVSSTKILNTINFNLSGGVLINLNRVYFNASFVQETGPYQIYSSLGTSNTYYHYVQLGIGYKLFKSKPKK